MQSTGLSFSPGADSSFSSQRSPAWTQAEIVPEIHMERTVSRSGILGKLLRNQRGQKRLTNRRIESRLMEAEALMEFSTTWKWKQSKSETCKTKWEAE